MVLRKRMADTIPLTAQSASAPKNRLLKFEETPAWYEASEFILTGYRPESRSTTSCFRSWTYLHNESCNIYSHLIPSICAILGQSALQSYLSAQYPEAPWGDQFMFSFHLFTVAVCWGLSSLYHTFMNHSLGVARRWLVCDFMGIVTLILGDFISGIYFGFYCHQGPKFIYWFMIIALGSVTAVILLSPRYQGPEWRTFRLSTFVGTGLSAFAPIAHAGFIFGFSNLGKLGVLHYLAEGLILIIASYIYERQIPERWYPGKFDIWAHSHTIFHLLVVLATGVHFLGLLSAFGHVYSLESC